MTGHIAKPVGPYALARQYREHAGHCFRGAHIDLADIGVRDACAQHVSVSGILEMNVVGVTALAGDQGLVFETPNGLANAEFHDLTSSKIATRRGACGSRFSGRWGLGSSLDRGETIARNAIMPSAHTHRSDALDRAAHALQTRAKRRSARSERTCSSDCLPWSARLRSASQRQLPRRTI